MKSPHKTANRRQFLIGGTTAGLFGLAMPGILRAQQIPLADAEQEPPVRRNVSSFRVQSWRDHFDTLKGGAILSDTTSKMLQYWSEDESVYKVFPTSVPLSDDLTRLGYTKIIRKVDGPSWAPTPSMKKRNPE